MIKLEPYKVCPFGVFCEYSYDYVNKLKCNGLNPERKSIFICELWAENYKKKGMSNARDN